MPETDYGFKRITLDNWLLPDAATEVWVLIDRTTGTGRKPRGEDFVRHALAVSIGKQVPLEVRALFEVARGALVYGYLFYPLFTLGMQQLLRVAEAGVHHRCESDGLSTKAPFVKLIDLLGERGTISASTLERWHNLRDLRNISSHPHSQEICPPGVAFGFLEMVAMMLHELFPLVESPALYPESDVD